MFNGKTHYKWPCSIAFCMFTRGYSHENGPATVTVPVRHRADSPRREYRLTDQWPPCCLDQMDEVIQNYSMNVGKLIG